MASGKTILQLKDEFVAKPKAFPKFDKKVLWLDRENEDLENEFLIELRRNVKRGIVAETEGLLRAGSKVTLQPFQRRRISSMYCF